MDIIFKNASFGYNAPLLADMNFHFSKGWSAIVGANGSGKSTVVYLALGRLIPDSGRVTAGEGICCEQRCDEPPAGFDLFCGSCDGSARRLAGEFSIEADWHERWHTLSFGERKRAQIAAALWHEPEILALDEPTNHLDRAARLLLVEALSRYRGTGLLVSHDRELLEALPYQCLHLDPPHAVMRPGNYFDGKIQAEMEREYALAQKEKIAANISRLQRDAAVRRGLACSADRLRSKKGLCKKDHDAREKIDRARISGKDGVQGKILRQLDGRIRQEQERLESISAKRDADSRIFFRDAPLRGGYVLSMEDGIIPMCNRTIRHPLLSVRRGEKIAVMGPNGSGKTTLLQHIRQLVPDAFFIAQEISAEQSRETLGTVLRMEKEPRGRILTAVENLGTDVKRLLATDQPSPGEIRKLCIAAAIENSPSLILMDEPTNHMDLHSVELLEKCLAESSATMVIVSHDMRFVRNVAGRAWNFGYDDECGCCRIRVCGIDPDAAAELQV